MKAIGFAIGSQSVGATTDGAGVGANMLILTQDPAPSYNVASAFAGDAAYGPSSDTDAFDITQEDARTTYTGTSYAIADNSGKATLTLSATIKDISAPEYGSDPAYDMFAGDIRYARVDFVNRDASNAVLCSANVGLVNPSDAQVGTATCNYTVNIGSADAQSFTIGIVVRHYYKRNNSDDNSIIQVSRAVPGLITGGGYLRMFDPTRSVGLYPGAANTKTNFGFNIRNDSKSNSPKGNINVIIRNGGRVYQIKGNAMTSLGTDMRMTSNHPFPTATFNGKANIQDITNPLNVISIDGNTTLQVTMTDQGNNGDAISVTVWNKGGGIWYASNWNGTKTIEQTLGGGNLVVR